MTSPIKDILKQFPFIAPRIVYSCKDWIDKKNRKGGYRAARADWYKLIESSEYHHHPLPNSVGPINKNAFDINMSYKTSDSYLFNLKNVFLYGSKGIILSNYNECFQEFTHHFNIQTLKSFFFKNPFYTFTSEHTKVEGTAAVLVSPESHNYYHWIFDVLPRIKLYEHVFDKIDYFYISSAVPEKFTAILSSFGVPKEKLRLIGDKEKIKFANLFVASLPGSEGRSPKWAVDYIREKLCAETQVSPLKKLYFKRGDANKRKIINEEEIISLLESQGFVIIEPEQLSIIQQARLVSNANVIISAHGAALSNLVFVQKDNCKIMEIFSPDYFRTDCYYTLAGILNLDYWYIIGGKLANACWGDIVVREDILKETLEKIDQTIENA